ncbi:MAG: ATP-binding cassette domain-containing protein [Candidatus Omnitrophota bacterium]
MNMEEDLAIELRDVSETYEIEIKTDEKTVREETEVLKNISLKVKKGESIAILGANGAGKSTILRVIAGLLKPDKGDVCVRGVVGSLLDLGAGFHPELTGRENLRLNAGFYNFNRSEFEARYEEILKFADIGKFIDVPVRCYSQGMYVRLAFSLAIHVNPDILLIDDCLSVGDDNFQLKCIDKALELKMKNKTIVLVTHNFTLAKQLCQRGIYIRDQGIALDATVDQAVSTYLTVSKMVKDQYQYLKARIQEIEDYEKTEADSWQRKIDLQRQTEQLQWDQEAGRRREADDRRWEEETLARRQKEELQWDQEFARVRAQEEVQWLQEVKRRRDAEGLAWAVEVGQRRDADDAAWEKAAQERRAKQERDWADSFMKRCADEQARWEKEMNGRREVEKSVKANEKGAA